MHRAPSITGLDWRFAPGIPGHCPGCAWAWTHSEVAGAEYMNHRDVHTAVRHPAEHGFVDAYSKDQEGKDPRNG